MEQEQLILKERPNGLPDKDTFQFKKAEVHEPGEGEILLKTLYVSVDPYIYF